MNREGGKIAPRPIVVRVTPGEVRYWFDVVEPQQAKYRDEQGWKRGMHADTYIAALGRVVPGYCVIGLYGKVAEGAVSGWISRSVPCTMPSTEVCEHGDSGPDLIIAGFIGVQVKARTSKYDSTFVRQVDENGATLQNRFDAIVLCEWTGGASLSILGWLPKVDFERIPLSPSCVRGMLHQNRDVRDLDLHPMRELIIRAQEHYGTHSLPGD